MTNEDKKNWWDELPDHVGSDVIVGEVGEGATGVAIGKNITQTVHSMLGEPIPEDKQIIDQSFEEVVAAIREMREDLEEATVEMAEFQLSLLQGELTKVEEDTTPSASTITQVGDWLLDNVPDIAEILSGLFATPAVGKVVGKAGEIAVGWVRKRFGKRR